MPALSMLRFEMIFLFQIQKKAKQKAETVACVGFEAVKKGQKSSKQTHMVSGTTRCDQQELH